MILNKIIINDGKTKILCKCDNNKCLKEFWRVKAEVDRNIKNGKLHQYCCLSCCANTENNIYRINNYPKSAEHLKKYTKLDDNSPFRYYIHSIRYRKNKYSKKMVENNITIEDIKQQWEKQNGICPYTKQNLILPLSTSGFDIKSDIIFRASLDRIDTKKGYIKDNIQFVSIMINWAKNKYSHEDTIKFCEVIANYWKDKI